MNILRRFFNTLQSRLIFTHMLVAVAVLFVAALIVLLLQAPLRSETMVQRMAEWLQPTVTLARNNFASIAAADDGEAEERFFTYLRSQADAQNARILLITQPGGAIVFDSEDRLQGRTWQPGEQRAFEMPSRRMRGSMMPMIADVRRGATELDGDAWHYVSTLLLPLRGGSLDLVVLKARPSLLRTMGESITELPRGLLIGGLLALGAAIFLLSRWTAGAVTRSLKPLLDGTHALAGGNLAYRVDTGHVSLTEVHALAASFNQMADRVQQGQQAQRDFIANVSHDLKTPLTSIQGYSQALLDGTARTTETQQRAALVINQEAQRLTHLVEEVIDLARLESGRLHLHRQPVDPNELGAETVESFRPHFEAAQVELAWSPSPDALQIMADAARVHRALTNLLDNALKHSAATGKVTLAVEPVDAAVQFSVTDTGAGIPAEEIGRIWERFYRIDRSRTGGGGSGLGLAIVKEIVEAHGGVVGVESITGQGSRFWFRLPKTPPDR
ncbi:MAG: HAMP domain-containing sensor histidine kinase [Caldilinea sp.]